MKANFNSAWHKSEAGLIRPPAFNFSLAGGRALSILLAHMRKSSSLIVVALRAGLILFSLTAGVAAQSPRNPTMASQTEDALKDQLFAQFTEYKRSLNPEEHRLAYPAAKDYLRKFGGEDDSNAREVRKFVVDYERAVSNADVFTAYNAKNYAKAFELGRPHLKADADDFFVLSTLTEAGYENALAGNATLNEETIGYARRAIKLLEGGKVTRADPFKSMAPNRAPRSKEPCWNESSRLPSEPLTPMPARLP